MSFTLGYSPWLLFLVLVGAGGLTYWTYRRTIPRLNLWRKGLLGGLRFMALGLLLLLLFEPVLRRTQQTEQPSRWAVLADNSQSLGPRSDADTSTSSTAQQARRALRTVLEDLGTDAARPFFFGSSVSTPEGDFATVPDSLRFQEARTDIVRALSLAREELQQDNLRGVVLLSDGQYNTGRNPLYLADRYPVPIYTIVAGDTTRRKDVRIRRVVTNEIAYADTELPVQVRLHADGFAGQRTTVSLYKDGQRLQRQTVSFPTSPADVSAELTFTPRTQGLQQYEVRVTPLDGEVTTRNNSATFSVRVLDSKKQVLLLGAAPGPDVSAIRRVLDRINRVNVEAYVQKGPGTFYEGPLPDDLSEVDVLVLAGYPGAAARQATAERLASAAEEDDVPLLFLLTQQTDLQALQRHLADVLPMQIETTRPGFVDAALQPTPSAQQHPIFDVPEVPLSLIRSLPPLRYNESRWRTSPDATVLATTQVRGVELDDPMLLIRQRTGQRSAAWLGAGVWRWANLPEDLDRADPLWPALLSNLLQWVSTPENDRRVRIEPTRPTFSGGEPVELTGQVYDESLNPIDNASVEVNVIAPDSTRYPYTMEAQGNGQYLLDIGTLPEGTYSYTATATEDGTTIGTDQGRFTVGKLSLEFQETRADVGLMRQIAHRSGGAAFTADNASALLDSLQRADLLAPTYRSSTQDLELQRAFSLLAVVLVLLSAEWFLRKRSGMV